MSVHYEARFTGNLKLKRDDEIANRLRKWLLDTKLLMSLDEDSKEFENFPDDGYFKFKDEDFSENGVASDFLKALKNSDDFRMENDVFYLVGYFTNDFTENLKLIIEEKEDDIIYISICIGNKNRNDNIYYLIYLLWSYMEDGFQVVIDNESCLMFLNKNYKNNLLPDYLQELPDKNISHFDVLEKIGLVFKEYEDLDSSYCKAMYDVLVEEEDFYG